MSSKVITAARAVAIGGIGSFGGQVAMAASTVTATSAAAGATAAGVAALAAASAPTRRHACARRPPGCSLGTNARGRVQWGLHRRKMCSRVIES